jgi:hypothetical protein
MLNTITDIKVRVTNKFEIGGLTFKKGNIILFGISINGGLYGCEIRYYIKKCEIFTRTIYLTDREYELIVKPNLEEIESTKDTPKDIVNLTETTSENTKSEPQSEYKIILEKLENLELKFDEKLKEISDIVEETNEIARVWRITKTM